MNLTTGEQIIMDRLRYERRLFFKRLVILLAEIGGAVLLMMRG